MLKICKTCGKEKHRSEFPSTGNRTRVDGSVTKMVKPDCKECHNLIQKNRIDKLFEEIGVVWECVRCGYNTYVGSMDFHHTDPTRKDFSIAARQCISKQRLAEEISKCVLLCRNCHGELHAGLWNLSELGN